MQFANVYYCVCTTYLLLYALLYLWIACWIGLFRCLLTILLLNVMVLFCIWVCFLLLSPYMVSHSVCVFCLWSHCLFRCSSQMSVLCFFIQTLFLKVEILFFVDLCSVVNLAFYLMCSGTIVFRDVVFVRLQNDVYDCCICNVWGCGYFFIFKSSYSLFCEFYSVCFIAVSWWVFLFVKFESGVCG